jgi:hypothetical protein
LLHIEQHPIDKEVELEVLEYFATEGLLILEFFFNVSLTFVKDHPNSVGRIHEDGETGEDGHYVEVVLEGLGETHLLGHCHCEVWGLFLTHQLVPTHYTLDMEETCGLGGDVLQYCE